MKEFLEFKVNLDTFISDLQTRLDANEAQIEALLKQKNKIDILYMINI
mgnify:CR=1 FL=1